MLFRSLFFVAAALVWAAASPTIELKDGRFVVAGVSGMPRFSVHVESNLADPPALLGAIEITDGTLIFTPKYPLSPGLSYRAVLHTDPPVEARFKLAEAAAGPATQVSVVYPTTDRIPENQLKFYLHFSAPMSRGEAYSRLHLLDQEGREIEAPFLELDQELWDPTGTRFTLLFDPGRIKRDLVPNKESGPPLVPGRHVTFVIDAAWHDAAGRPLGREFRKEFTVVAADRKPPSLWDWKLLIPVAGTTSPLVVSFGEPLDHALLEHLVSVEGVTGTAAIGARETEWRFTPATPWKVGAYNLAVDTALEDLAGNRIDRPFDVDLFEKVDREIKHETRKVEFRVR